MGLDLYNFLILCYLLHMDKANKNRKTFYDELLSNALAIPGLKIADSLRIDNILSGQTYYRKLALPNPLSDLSFYLTILDGGQLGFSYYNGQPKQGKSILKLVNKNALEVLESNEDMDLPLRVSLLDAVYGAINQRSGIIPHKIKVINDSYSKKADFRSSLVTEQLEKNTNVLLVGLVPQFVRDMKARDIQVSVSDMSPELEGTTVYGIPIINSGNAFTLDKLKTCDAAIVTGASIATDTIDSIFEIASASNTKLHFYLETGSNFAPELIRRGAVSVVAEKFPFYDFPGEARFEVYI